MSEPCDIIFSGIQPTGCLHLGNYLGAVRYWPQWQQPHRRCLYSIVDLHALTAHPDPAALRESVYQTAAILLAVGVDTRQHILFVQSSNPHHSELAWVLGCVARMGWMQRMTQFKEKVGKNREKAPVGLFTYPILMAADILAHQATMVPVGDDQRQHLELCRDIALSFNERAGGMVLTVPEGVVSGEAARVMSLRNGAEKMSKSHPSAMSRINMIDSNDTVAQKIRKAKTDTLPLPETVQGLENRPEARNLLTIHAALAQQELPQSVAEFAGSSFLPFKESLIERLVATIAPIRQRYDQYMNDRTEIAHLLDEGGQRARMSSSPTLAAVYAALGMREPSRETHQK